MTVTIGQGLDAQRWNVFARAHGDFFHRHEWADIVRKVYRQEPVFLWAEEQGECTGILPLIDRRSALFGRALISLGFTTGGGVAALTPAAEASLVDAAVKMGQDRGAAYVELRGHGGGGPGWRHKTDIYDQFAFVLEPTPERRLLTIPRKKRADLRKAITLAEAGHLRAGMTEDAALFWQCFAVAQRRLGTPVVPKNLFAHQRDVFGKDMEIAMVWHGVTPLAGVVSYYHRDRVLLYSAFISDKARRYHAGDYLYWWMMEHAAGRGAKIFDLGRSKRGTGAHAYKTHWGITPEPLTYAYWLLDTEHMPNVNPQNPKFRLMSRAWRHMPAPLADRLGPYIARQMG